MNNVPTVIQSPGYPIELRTDAGSKLWINNEGDVIRRAYPSQSDEHILVTPYRDDTDNRVISALRVTNDGEAPGRASLKPKGGPSSPAVLPRTLGSIIYRETRLPSEADMSNENTKETEINFLLNM